ncbi:hypothetical protein MRB53_019161 [Persea americana]|uniref:Uncharacterized protein n=1 Tax=Persea americana TaxID=3435 RepID=A0ACC2MBC7_PERAE|nr:hypothetical protein MRB53_019161 [Persea americana]|eukprot:TRINITY_DN5602_c0_g1_i2.p1 TRINITY_DN5602_c0_g1~~TRINITY_DN5602_c0_g1_i2.p1  ORF type:complete len:963 (+),score=181.83 TRINITY_DN5602_c0_g1_i2:170-3058(+)
MVSATLSQSRAKMDRSSRSTPAMRFSSSMLFIVAILVLLVTGTYGSSSGRHKDGRSSVFSLFNLKGKSRFWSEAVIRGDFKDLESSVSSSVGKMGVLNYTKAGNIANYLKLSEIDSMYLPVPVNFIFIGFEGKGNHEFKLGSEELERWFTKIDHIFEHTRVPRIGEALTPFYKISIDKVQRHHLPLISHISYNFSVHAIQMGEKVTSVFEHAIKVLSRKDDILDNRDDEQVLWQVDMDRMDYLFTSLIDYLELENAYNIFILNPKHENKRASYGYRRGLSESEMRFLKENKSLQAKLLQSESLTQSPLEIDRGRRPLYAKHPMTKFAWTTAEDIDTVEWSNDCLDALNGVEKSYQGKDTSEIIYSKAEQMLHGKNDDMELLLEKELKSGELTGLHPECLTDTWMGKDRWAFIDLTAGPFSWGPAVGGEGVRTEISLPNVGKTIGAVAEITEEEAEDRLQDAIQEKFSVFGDQDHHAVDILLAEVDIYELFAFKHCKGRKVKLALCEELDERMQGLRNELQAFDSDEYDESHKRKASDALKRMESWNLFSDTYEDFQNYTVARDSFLAHLGATLWGSMRHIISPSVSDGAYHFYEKISFQLYFITQEKVRHAKQLPVQLKPLKDGLSSLLVPPQKVVFSQHMLTLSEDPALAMAFSVARRAAAVPLLLVNGTYRSTVRAYLDSSILEHQLHKLSDHGLLKGAHSHSRSTLEVPIFWFIHNEPILVDKHHQAKALSDMIIVVQSDPSSWESHLQCNGRSLLWDLRRPIKAALAATAEHLAGLLPLQLVYSQAHETAIEDWIWSVGCNPLSITSQGWQISRFQTDTIARSYIISALEESIQLVNAAVHLLVMERTTAQTFKLFKSQERELVNKYNAVVSMWRRISVVSGELRYSDAMNLLYFLEESSQGFMDSVNRTIAALHPIHCTRERKVQVELDMTTIPAFLVVFAILWFVLRPRRPKPKIN